MVLLQPDLGEGGARTAAVALEELGTLPLSGRVISLPTSRGLSIEVVYQAHWTHRYFGVIDGPLATFVVASSTLAEDGSFALNVPDFARDPLVANREPESRGAFRLRVREAGTGNSPYTLEEIQLGGTAATLPIARAYVRDLVLVGVPK